MTKRTYPAHDEALAQAMLADLATALKVGPADLHLQSISHTSPSIYATARFKMAAGYPFAHIHHDASATTYVVGCSPDDNAFCYAAVSQKEKGHAKLPLNEAAFDAWNASYSMPAKRLQKIAKLNAKGREDDAAWNEMWALRGSLTCEVFTALSAGDKVQFVRSADVTDATVLKGKFVGTGLTRGKYADDYAIVCDEHHTYHVPIYCVEAI